MGIKTTLVDSKGEKLSELPSVTENSNKNSNANSNSITNTDKNSSSKKNRRRPKKMFCPIQKLYDTCKDVFTFGGTGVVPSPEKIDLLRSVLDDIKPVDVGLTPDMPYFRRSSVRRTPPITYLHLHECDKFSMGIFCLPPSGVIPLHNHPGMTVFSKLLFGTMHIKSYDWVADVPCNTSSIVNPLEIQRPELRLAKVKVDSDFAAPCNTSILYPADGGNMHCFTAVTACAVLDVLGPPYSDREGRHCTYYLDFPFTKFSVDGVSVPEEEKEGYGWLQEREKPKDLSVVGAPYRGPKIVKK
ncbi:plant cysteine oxidase 2-like [Mangifera indica]|uniref:plant cysteine oxidase 2-like n=1 Tax=Mangifera indica TaxID=29780 RepID=UPI001CF983E5|nr:plant cysteine oxidase 2-like [Mangifera indica]